MELWLPIKGKPHEIPVELIRSLRADPSDRQRGIIQVLPYRRAPMWHEHRTDPLGEPAKEWINEFWRRSVYMK